MRARLGGEDREVFVARPEGTGPWPAVVVLHEVWGLSDDIRAAATRVAAQGYLALAPDLLGAGLTCMVRALRDLMRGQGTSVQAARDAVTLAMGHPDSDGRLGVVGFCLGGGFALLLADTPGVRAAAPCYGPVPRGGLPAGICPVVASYGARDLQFPRDGERLRAALVASGVAHDVVTYPHAGHSFMNAEAPAWVEPLRGVAHAAYDEATAQDAWRRIFAFFDDHVRADNT